MARQKTLRKEVARCKKCRANSVNAYLERIKGSKQYICDNCAASMAYTSSTNPLKAKNRYSSLMYDEEYNEDFLFI